MIHSNPIAFAEKTSSISCIFIVISSLVGHVPKCFLPQDDTTLQVVSNLPSKVVLNGMLSESSDDLCGKLEHICRLVIVKGLFVRLAGQPS